METRQFAEFYRPTKLDQVIGQDHAIEQIRNMFKNQIPHTLIITGPTGVAKTTLARIIGKIIASPIKQSISDNIIDYHEETLGSERGIDKIKDIIRQAQYLPKQSNYSVFVIDEIAKATPQAFSPLLDALESPPKKTVFILVTDEPQRLPKTIFDRAYRITLTLPEKKDIVKVLNRVVKAEKITFPSKKVVQYISKNTTSFREALVMLQSARDAGTELKLIMRAIRAVDFGQAKSAMQILIGLYTKKPGKILPILLKQGDCIELTNQLLRYNEWIMLNHFDKQVYVWNDANTEEIKEGLTNIPDVDKITHTHNVLVNLRGLLVTLSQFEQHHAMLARLGSLVYALHKV